jgi:hypothetical protein
MTTYAVLAPCNRIKPVRGRNLSQAAALNLARAEAGDFFGIFVVVDEATLAEVAAFNDGRRYRSYRTAAKAKNCNPTPTYAALLGAA